MGSCTCLLFCVRQEKKLLVTVSLDHPVFFWQCFFLRSVSACWLAALVPTVPLWWGNPYKQKQILMTNIKILFPFSSFPKNRNEKVWQDNRRRLGIWRGLQVLLPNQQCKSNKIMKKWDQNTYCIHAKQLKNYKRIKKTESSEKVNV